MVSGFLKMHSCTSFGLRTTQERPSLLYVGPVALLTFTLWFRLPPVLKKTTHFGVEYTEISSRRRREPKKPRWSFRVKGPSSRSSIEINWISRWVGSRSIKLKEKTQNYITNNNHVLLSVDNKIVLQRKRYNNNNLSTDFKVDTKDI